MYLILLKLLWSFPSAWSGCEVVFCQSDLSRCTYWCYEHVTDQDLLRLLLGGILFKISNFNIEVWLSIVFFVIDQSTRSSCLMIFRHQRLLDFFFRIIYCKTILGMLSLVRFWFNLLFTLRSLSYNCISTLLISKLVNEVNHEKHLNRYLFRHHEWYSQF